MDCIYIALSQTQWAPKRFTFLLPIHTLILTPTVVSAIQSAIYSSSWGAAGVRCLAHGHLHTWSGGTGDWTTNLPDCRQSLCNFFPI